MLLDALGCHEGVRDACGAGGDGEDLDVAGDGLRRLLRCRTGGDKAVIFLVVDEAAELLDGLGSDQCLLEVGIHDHGGELREDGEVLVVRAVRCGDHKEETARVAVHRGEVHAVGDGHRGKSCRLHAVALGVRGGDAVAEPRCAALLTGEDIVHILGFVAQAAALFHIVREQTDCLLL